MNAAENSAMSASISCLTNSTHVSRGYKVARLFSPRPPKPESWTEEQWKAFFAVATGTDPFAGLKAGAAHLKGELDGLARHTQKVIWEEFQKELQVEYANAQPQMRKVLAFLLNTIFGFSATDAQLQGVLDGDITVVDKENFGDVFATIFTDIFNATAVGEGFKERLPGVAEWNNFRRFLGYSSRIQMGAALVENFGAIIPFGIGDGIEGIGERIGKILGLEDAFEETLEPLMEKLIVAGLEQKFNRETKPTDLTAEQAIRAKLQNRIGDREFHQILDNLGLRDDIRQIILDMAAPNLAENEVQLLFQRGQIDADDVRLFFAEAGFQEPDLERKASTIIFYRQWQMERQLVELKGRQFQRGLITESDLRSHLATQGYTTIEEDLFLEIQRAEASLAREAKPKAITGSFNISPTRIRAGDSAVMTWNIRNATRIEISGFGLVGERGEREIFPQQSQTFTLTASADGEEEIFEAVVIVTAPRAKPKPTASLTVSPGRVTLGQPVELKWSTTNADTVVIDQIGPVAEDGATVAFPLLTTIYTLRAANAQGVTIAQDVAIVSLPKIEPPEDQPKPPVLKLTFKPAIISIGGQTELTWSIEGADKGTLILPDGSSQEVGPQGVMILQPPESGIVTLRAENAQGESVFQDAIIVSGLI
jgi:hypothetical protein